MFRRYREEAEFALRAVRTAALLSRQIQHEMVTPALEKSDRSPVTVADFASQALVAGMLQQAFPEDPLVAEEDSTSLRQRQSATRLEAVTEYVSTRLPDADPETVCRWIDKGRGSPQGRSWILDPVDGTKGFLRGDQYAVALALLEDDEVRLGALGCPNLNRNLEPEVGGSGSAIIAVQGEGTWTLDLEGGEATRLRVSTEQNPRRARILRSFASEHTDSAKIEQLSRLLGTEHEPILMDSAAKYALLAAGRGELLFRLLSPHRPDYVEKIWDQAPGALLVQEAGGRVTDLLGRPLDFGQGRLLGENLGVLASNGRLHQAALEAIRAAGADQRPEAA